MSDYNDKYWKMVCTTKDYTIHVRWQQEGDKLVGTVQENPDNRFIFSDITESSFHRQNNGETQVISNIYAVRK